MRTGLICRSVQVFFYGLHFCAACFTSLLQLIVFTRSLQFPAVQAEAQEDESELQENGQDVGVELDVREGEGTVWMDYEVINGAGKAKLGRKRKNVAEEILAAPSKQSRSLFNHILPNLDTVATCASSPNAVFSFESPHGPATAAAREEANLRVDEVGFEDTGAQRLSKEAKKDAIQPAGDTGNPELDTGVVREAGEGGQDAIISSNLEMGEHHSSCQLGILEDEDRTMGDEEEKLEDLDQMGVQKKSNQPGTVDVEQQENMDLGQPLATSSKKDLQFESDDMLVIDLSDSDEAEEVQYVCSVKNEESEKTKLSGNLAEGVKSAADDESVVNENVDQPLTTAAATVAAVIAAPVPPRPAFQHMPTGV